MKLSQRHNLFSVVGGLLVLTTTLNLALAGCGVPAAPQQPFAGRNLGGSDDECEVPTDTKKKTSTKKSVGLVDKKTAGKTAADEVETSCDDKNATGSGTGTASKVNNGIVTPGQTLPGTTPITAIPGTQLGTTTTPGTQQLGLTVTYSAGVSAYLSRACTSCHGGGLFARSPNLSTYDAAKAGATASLNSMKAGRMPTSGKASDADIKLIESWIQAGMPQ